MPALHEVLTEAKERGFLGPGPVHAGIEHAQGFADGVDAPPGRLVDLGSGGGLPGLVLADIWVDAEVVLVEASERRATFLQEGVARLGYQDRVQVLRERAEETGRRPQLRARCDAVVARGFGPPAVTAECGAPLLRVGGRLLVSEPPSDGPLEGSRWPSDGLAELGLAVGPAWTTKFHYQALIQVALCPDRFPRRTGVPLKRPLF